MPAFQLARQRRLRRGLIDGLEVEDLAIGADGAFRGRMRVGIPLEAVEDATRDAAATALVISVHRWRRRDGLGDVAVAGVILLHLVVERGWWSSLLLPVAYRCFGLEINEETTTTDPRTARSKSRGWSLSHDGDD